jgi:hypothetical protein
MCRRSKRLVAAWYQPGGALNRGGATAGAVPTSNVAVPAAAPVYYAAPQQQGTPGAAPYMGQQSTGGYFPTAAPSDRGISPPIANASVVSPVGSSPGSMPSQPVHVGPSPGSPAPPHVIQEPHVGAHEMQ